LGGACIARSRLIKRLTFPSSWETTSRLYFAETATIILTNHGDLLVESDGAYRSGGVASNARY
jgi:hypothetical protein